MDGKSLKEKYSPQEGDFSKQVTTHFGNFETEHVPMVISLEKISTTNEYKNVVDKFYEDLKSKHPYQYQDVIGEGGMGVVEMVKDKKCLRSIARKTLNKAKCDKESLVRFTEEAQITAQLEHPNIVPVYELGLDEKDQLFYTMKMVKGLNLKEILNGIKQGDKQLIEKFPLARLLEIYLAICDAMAYACSRKIVHRDLKPDNIMVGDYGEVYIVDWGLAKVIKNDAIITNEEIPEWIVKEVYSKQDSETDKLLKELRKVDSLRTKNNNLNISFNDILIGTPQYMAPERFSGFADECSEVYALGAILYNILTLELTFNGESLEEIVTKIFEEDIKNPLSFKNLPHLPGGKVPPGLAAVTMKTLSVEPIDRYRTIVELRNEISAWEDGYITEAEKAGPWLVLWSMVKRHKIETGIALTFFLLLIAIYGIYAFKLKQDRILAENSERVALNQKEIVEQETAKLISKSLEVEEKIEELADLAPNLYRRSIYFTQQNKLEKALKAIKNACRLKPEEIYFIQQGNIEQSLKMFEESIISYGEALHLNSDSKLIKQSINFSKQFINKPLDSYTDKLKFKEFLINQKRFTEAALVSKELRSLTVNMKSGILQKFENTHFKFVKNKMLEVDSDGGFSLDISHQNLKDLSPLKGIPFKSLNLEGNPIDDISALNGMPLDSLNINDTLVSDLSPLRGSPLKFLKAGSSKITSLGHLYDTPLVELDVQNTDITSLMGLTSPFLKDIDISGTKVKSLRYVNWRSVNSLNINDTEISDLNPLRRMPITHLTLRYSKVIDISPLETGFLTTLDISGCKIKDFSPIQTLPLEKFIASNTEIQDIKFLRGKRLLVVNLDNVNIKDINHLRGMPISRLSLYNSAINNLNAAIDMPLEYLNLNRTKLKSLPNFNKMADLASIHLRDSEIENISSISGKNFEYLDLGRTKIKSIDGLKDCTIQRLNLAETKVSKLTALKGKSFAYLNISQCPVTDLSPLSESLITELDISRIPATDFTALNKMNLQHVTAQGIKVSSPYFINKQSIQYADFSDSEIIDISPLERSNIKILNMANTKISKISALRSCRDLIQLNLHGTDILTVRDISAQKLTTLILGKCEKLKSVYPLRKMKALEKLIIPENVRNVEALREMASLKFLGYTSLDHKLPIHEFWEKYDEGKPDEQ